MQAAELEVEAACARAIIISKGRVVADGAIDDVRARGGRVRYHVVIHEKEGLDGGSPPKAREVRDALKELEGTDLGASYAAEVALLDPYLPQLLDEAATRALVEPLVGQVNGIGPLMGRIMKSHKGKVDPGLVRRIAGELGIG